MSLVSPFLEHGVKTSCTTNPQQIAVMELEHYEFTVDGRLVSCECGEYIRSTSSRGKSTVASVVNKLERW